MKVDFNEYDTKKVDIIKQAYELFASVGYRETTVKMITGKLGTAKGTFYYYFKSKEEVLNAVVDYLIQNEFVYYEELSKTQSKPFEKLVSVLNQMIVFSVDQEALIGLVKKRFVSVIYRITEQVLEYMTPYLSQIFVEGNAIDEMKVANPEQTALLILNDMVFIIHGAVFSNKKDKTAILNTMYDMTEKIVGLRSGALRERCL